jgi:hypothetical protein
VSAIISHPSRCSFARTQESKNVSLLGHKKRLAINGGENLRERQQFDGHLSVFSSLARQCGKSSTKTAKFVRIEDDKK